MIDTSGARPRAFSFLSGLPKEERRLRELMPVQVFSDESGGSGHSRHFVMAALIADSEAWLNFSDEWRSELREPPALRYFKMREAANPSGQFAGLSAPERDKKLRRLAKIINRHARIYTHSIIDLTAFSEVWRGKFAQTDNPYFWPYQNTILAAGFSLWDLGLRDRFEAIFDEHLIFGPRAKIWYPVIRELTRLREPDLFTILPVDPLFRKDDEFLPLQAADMFAWCARREADGLSNTFEWLIPEFSDIMRSDYSQFYNAERMKEVIELSAQQRREGNIEKELIEKYQETHERIYGRGARK